MPADRAGSISPVVVHFCIGTNPLRDCVSILTDSGTHACMKKHPFSSLPTHEHKTARSMYTFSACVDR